MQKSILPIRLASCLVRTLKKQKKLPGSQVRGLNERGENKFRDYGKRFQQPPDYSRIEKAMQDYPLYSQDSKKKDAVCIAVFFISNASRYILEGQRENDDFVLFGIVVGLAETEYSYISANEMSSVELDATKP